MKLNVLDSSNHVSDKAKMSNFCSKIIDKISSNFSAIFKLREFKWPIYKGKFVLGPGLSSISQLMRKKIINSARPCRQHDNQTK